MNDDDGAGSIPAGTRASGSRAIALGSNEPGPSDPSTRAAALAWLAHPVSLAGIAILLVNDHVLKAAFGTWWTGKLSDVAGLVFAPALVALVAALLSPRAHAATVARGAIVGVGLVFAFVKVTAVGAIAASAAWTAVTETALGTASVIRQDPTDLLALPALALAWWAFTRAGGHHGRDADRARPRRLVGTLAIVAGVAATAATGASPDPYAATVERSADGSVVLTVLAADYHGGIAFETTADGVAWREACPSYSEPCGPRDAPQEPTSKACVAAEPSVCFRVVAGGLGVEHSGDAGKTWRPEWTVSEDERARLTTFYEISNYRRDLESRSLAIADGPDGYVVIVANGYDGVAVRHASGVWERRGLLDTDCCAWVPIAPLDPSVPLPTFAPAPPWIGATAVLTCLAFLAMGWRTRGRLTSLRGAGPWAIARRLLRWGAAALVTGLGVAYGLGMGLVASVPVYRNAAEIQAADFTSQVLVLFGGALGGVLVMAGSAIASAPRPGLRGRSWLAALGASLAGAAAAGAANLVSDSLWVVATAGGMGILLGVALGWRWLAGVASNSASADAG